MDRLAVYRNGERIPDLGTVALDALADRDELVELTIANDTGKPAQNVRVVSDLPDGAFVDYQVAHAMSDTTPADDWPATNLIESGRATVAEGQFWARINTFNWPRGDVRVVVQFPLPPQPPEVEARYGAFGERLAGDDVVTVAGARVVEVEHAFEHRR